MFVRVAVYWFIYLVTLWNLLFVWRLIAEGPGNLLEQYWRFLQDFYPPLVAFMGMLYAAIGGKSIDALQIGENLVFVPLFAVATYRVGAIAFRRGPDLRSSGLSFPHGYSACNRGICGWRPLMPHRTRRPIRTPSARRPST